MMTVQECIAYVESHMEIRYATEMVHIPAEERSIQMERSIILSDVRSLTLTYFSGV